MDVGLRVVRGPGWKWQNEDGGEGHVGTVVEVIRTVNNNKWEKTVVIQWDSGSRTSYRLGHRNECELLVWDRSPTGWLLFKVFNTSQLSPKQVKMCVLSHIHETRRNSALYPQGRKITAN